MIIVGDIACPDDKVDDFVSCVKKIGLFKDEIVVANCEGMFLNEKKRPKTLWNSDKTFNAFENAKKVVVSLANNHTYDYPSSIRYTESKLEEQSIGVFGLSEDDKSILPYEFEEGGIKYAFFGHCWRLYTHTNKNNENKISVADCQYDSFIKYVGEYISRHSDTKVFCLMHWNYDLEILPFPMHRRLSRALIDVGVEGVFGGHSHVPHGSETYKGKPIVYGLGNFYLPSGIFFDGKLIYPKESHITYALRINNDEHKIIWLCTDGDNKPLSIIGEEDFVFGSRIQSISKFRDFDDKRYITFFKKNRKKKFLVPVFCKYSGLVYRMKETWAIMRVLLLRKIK